jgi:chromosome segregation ATPase
LAEAEAQLASLQDQLTYSRASLAEAEARLSEAREQERTRAEVQRMQEKVEEDLRRQVASLSHKLDSTLQGRTTVAKFWSCRWLLAI